MLKGSILSGEYREVYKADQTFFILTNYVLLDYIKSKKHLQIRYVLLNSLIISKEKNKVGSRIRQDFEGYSTVLEMERLLVKLASEQKFE